jgi:hypothetical protein
VDLSDEELAGARQRISRGIIAEAIASGRTVLTPSAFLDARFSGQDSVRETRIEAVCCAPIGDPARGVLYLQHTSEPGAFDESVRAQVELVTRYLGPALERVLARQVAADGIDPTEDLRRRLPLDAVVGRSRALADVLQQVLLAAPLDVTVLLSGESGTGKTLLARVVHQAGPRAGGPFVELNCANLPDELLESELFGAEQGAHSTATRRVQGKIAAAEHGTLFLDEIGELSARAQAKAQIGFDTNQRASFEAAVAKGHVVVEPDASITDAVAAWVEAGVGDMAGIAMSTYGVQDPEALFASFAPYVEKWRGLVGGMADQWNEDELTALIIANLYDNLDPATYGVE